MVEFLHDKKIYKRYVMNFTKKLYQHKEISEEALDEVFEDFPGMNSQATSETLMRDITERELATTVISLAKGKASGHDEIPVEVFPSCGR